MKMLSRQNGFTLIELVMVIVILGILASVAIPRFIDLTGKAQQAALQGIAGSLGTAASNNYAACASVGNVVTANICVQVSKCSDVASLVVPTLTLGAAGAAISGTYNVAVDTAANTNGTLATCTLQIITSGTTYTSTYTAIGAGH